MRNRIVAMTGVVMMTGLFWSSKAAAQSGQAECFDVPQNVQVASGLGPLVRLAIQQAPTIRQQMGRIAAAPHVRVTIRLYVGRPLGGARAEATITRFEHGALFAEIRLPVCVDQIEMLAHELEHVVEQMDGLNFARLAAARAGGVSRLQDGTFETERARKAGRVAAEEFKLATARTKAVKLRRADSR